MKNYGRHLRELIVWNKKVGFWKSEMSKECDVCLDSEPCEDDDVLTCDGCNVSTHESCGGKDNFVNEEPGDTFLCPRCKHIHEKAKLDSDSRDGLF